MLRIYPKILLILDNAPCHKSETVTEFVKANEDRLRLVFLGSWANSGAVDPVRHPIRIEATCGRYSSGDTGGAALNSEQ